MKPQLHHCSSSAKTQKTTISFMAALMFFAAGISACASLESPRISLSDMALQQTTGFETVLQVSLRVLNPNDIGLNIRGVDCTLKVNGKPFARGISNAPVQVPAFGSSTVPITVFSSALDIARSLISMPGHNEVNYELKGYVRLEKTGWLISKLPFKSGGTVSLKDFEAWLVPKKR
jgi:LEA14-like dessication related protein